MNDKQGRLWLAFDTYTSAHDARKRFVEKYGVEAEEVRGGLGMILVGPVPEEKELCLAQHVADLDASFGLVLDGNTTEQ